MARQQRKQSAASVCAWPPPPAAAAISQPAIQQQHVLLGWPGQLQTHLVVVPVVCGTSIAVLILRCAATTTAADDQKDGEAEEGAPGCWWPHCHRCF